MADSKIEGKNWYKEVKSPKDSVPYSERLDFYLKRAAIKTDLQSLSSDFDATISGQILGGKFKSLDDLKSFAKFEKNLKSGDTIYKILLEYFSKICAPDQAKKETYLSLAYLMKSNSGANVDKLYAGGTVVIESGKITVANKAGVPSLKDALLRPEVLAPAPAPTPEQEPVPIGGASKNEGPKYEPEPTPVEGKSKSEGPKVEPESVPTPVEGGSKNEGPRYEPALEPAKVESKAKDEGPKVAIEPVPPLMPVLVEVKPKSEKLKVAPAPEAKALEPIRPEVEKDKRLANARGGDFKFDVVKFMDVQVSDKYGETLYHFIKGTLLAKGIIAGEMPENDKLAYIDAIISVCRLANRGMNLDDFNSIKGKTIKFPAKMTVSPEFDKISKSYKRLQGLAEDDGYQISVPAERDQIYAEAMKTGKVIPESKFYFRKGEGTKDSPAVLQEDALEKFTAIAKEFSEKTGGWQISYSDVLRTEALQYDRNPRMSNSTHYTGRSIDITDGRFKKPDGKEITYSGNKEFIPKIEKEFRPLIVELIHKHGGVAFVEPGHWHLYFPKTRIIDIEGSKDVIQIKAPQAEGPAISPEPLVERSDGLLKNPEKLSSKEVDRRMKAFKEKYSEFSNMTPMRIVFDFGPIENSIKNSYKNWTYEKLQSEIDRLSMSRETRKANQPAINSLTKMRNYLVYKDMLAIVVRMSPADVKRYSILNPSALHERGEGNEEVRFDDLVSVWDYKARRKGSSAIFKKRYPALKPRIKSLDHSVTIEKWHAKQIKATEYFNKHAEELGVKSEMGKYVDAGVYLAVINAEFFNELHGETFVTLAPVIFESYNIMHGPAVHDEEFSAGSVQLIGGTFQELQKNYGKKIRETQKKDAGYKVLVPNMDNNDEYVRAMLVDFDSNLFYAQLCIYDHIESASEKLMADTNFKKAWGKASVNERRLFVAGLAPAAINSGKKGAKNAAGRLLDKVNTTNLSDYTARLKDAFRKFASRGAECGVITMDAYQRLMR